MRIWTPEEEKEAGGWPREKRSAGERARTARDSAGRVPCTRSRIVLSFEAASPRSSSTSCIYPRKLTNAPRPPPAPSATKVNLPIYEYDSDRMS